MNTEYIGKNLRRIIRQQGKTLKEVATAVGMSSVSLSNILNGKNIPKSSTVIKLASYLNISLEKLLVTPVLLQSIRFRTVKTLSAREKAAKEQLLVDIPVWLEHYRELEKALGKPANNELSKIKTSDACKTAQAVRVLANIKEDAPICDIVSIVSQLGIKLWLHDFGMKKIFGLSVGFADGGPAIIVNDNPDISIERKIFTIAHELGHLLFHLGSYSPPLEQGEGEQSEEEQSEEAQANKFAGELLLPSSGCKRQWEQYKGLCFVERVLAIKHLFKVSYRTVLCALVRDGLYKDDMAQLFSAFSQGYREKFGHDLKNHYEPMEGQCFVAKVDPEPLQPWDLVSTEYQGLVREAYQSGCISISKAAEMLSLDLPSMRLLHTEWKEETDA